MQYYLIGDIHGCYDEFTKLINKLFVDTEMMSTDSKIILLGDLIDRGDDTFHVISFVKGLRELFGDDCIIIRGNHEDMCLDAKHSNDNFRTWAYNGSMQTLESFEKNKYDIEDFRKWVLENTVLYYESPLFQCAHASILNEETPISETDKDILIWDRWQITCGDYNGKLTIVGHTPVDYPIHRVCAGDNFAHNTRLKYDVDYDLPERGIIDIDTSCVYGGVLTAMVIDDSKKTMRFISSRTTEELNNDGEFVS